MRVFDKAAHPQSVHHDPAARTEYQEKPTPMANGECNYPPEICHWIMMSIGVARTYTGIVRKQHLPVPVTRGLRNEREKKKME